MMAAMCLRRGYSKNEEDLSELLERLTVREKPYVKWDDIVGLRNAKETLQEAFILPLRLPHLFTGKRRPWKSVLLYGSPGTGKTSLAQALGTVMESCTFILLSKCLGESERLLKSLLWNKKTRNPTIILIDDIDVLFESESARGAKMALLTYMRDPRKECDGILILATANEPWLLDEELLKRFEKKVYTPLPDGTERLEILKFFLRDIPHKLTEEDLKFLTKKTEDYSGGDISALVQDALMQPVRKVKWATHYRKVSGPSRFYSGVVVNDLLTPCAPSCPGSMEMSWEEIPGDKLLEPAINLHDMTDCYHRSKPTVDEYNLRRYERFQERFG